MLINQLKPVRREMRKGYTLELSIMIAVSKQAMKKLNKKFESIDRKLALLLSGHHLLAADRLVNEQDADEKTYKTN